MRRWGGLGVLTVPPSIGATWTGETAVGETLRVTTTPVFDAEVLPVSAALARRCHAATSAGVGRQQVRTSIGATWTGETAVGETLRVTTTPVFDAEVLPTSADFAAACSLRAPPSDDTSKTSTPECRTLLRSMRSPPRQWYALLVLRLRPL